MHNGTPYTYLIGWKNLNTYYYGVRYSKGCSPKDLFITYFTSSKYVKEFISIHGGPDLIEIRKTFKDIDSAQRWETTVLRRMNVIHDIRFLNKSNNKSIDYSLGIQGGEIGRNISMQRREIFYNNGVEQKKFLYGFAPGGWVKGKIPKIIPRRSNDSGTSNGKWYHDPNNPTNRAVVFDKSDIPHGWIVGKGKVNRINCYWFNNGIIESQFSIDNAPEGWNRGRIKIGLFGNSSTLIKD